MKKPGTAAREAAEALAIQALGYLAEDTDRLGRFLVATGISPTAIRGASREPGFLAGVLEHMLGDESLLLDFAASAGIDDPSLVARAQQVLGGRWERDIP